MSSANGGYAFPHPVIDDRGMCPLTSRERMVFEQRQAGMTLDAIAKDIGGTRERVRQLVAKANYKLAAKLRISPGMTLRDYFAGQAIVGMLSNPELARIIGESAVECERSRTAFMAQVCWGVADGMIAERDKEIPPCPTTS